ncbi:K+ transport system, NAD-binding component [Nostoc sp. PCC 7524]|uniref:potassium channel family protein n=1 Tax=Nostoc sp. (strain ATCC 29411 / PCC 7524) TaxID=28072 RepID=UPI00029EE9C0|nr:potassium channel protein [Nostoc sp. PCC 7524]AFY46162.1 K+ transport system, NAD-binding component [Nostoc sp. PCC 7524]
MGQNVVSADTFLVCGLGSLGQYCVSVLKEFGVRVNAIEAINPQKWEISDLPDLIDHLVIGDCCQPRILEQAGIRQSRSILIVTSDERVNIAVAFAARSLNPDVRLVIRSSQDNLNELLRESLGNFVAFEATQLPAKSFALAALGSETTGFFTLENHFLQVMQVSIDTGHRWRNFLQLHEINTSHRRILTHNRAGSALAQTFYEWEPDTPILPGDIITYIEATENLVSRSQQPVKHIQQLWRTVFKNLTWANLRYQLIQFWVESSQARRVVLMSCLVMASLFFCGAFLYKLQYPQISWQEALNVSLVLSLGGYGDLFGGRELPFVVPGWLHLFSISQTVASTVFVGILYAVMTERILAARFQFSMRRLPVPKSDHVVLVGLGRVGRLVAHLLQELKQPLIGINSYELDPSLLPPIPLIVGNIKNALNKVNITTAKSVIVVTDDEVTNLEIALMSHAANPKACVVIRTVDPRFSENVARLLPYARVLGVYELAAEAFVGAAFGENILNLFRLHNQTTLVTEYQIEANDTLNGRLLGEIAYGYGVVPILHTRNNQRTPKFMPSDDIRLIVGDRLVVLATIEGLQRVERGTMLPRQCLVRVEKAVSQEAVFEGAALISRISGCDMYIARTLMNQLPGTLQCPLYKHQAHRLVNELVKCQVSAYVAIPHQT